MLSKPRAPSAFPATSDIGASSISAGSDGAGIGKREVQVVSPPWETPPEHKAPALAYTPAKPAKTSLAMYIPIPKDKPEDASPLKEAPPPKDAPTEQACRCLNFLSCDSDTSSESKKKGDKQFGSGTDNGVLKIVDHTKKMFKNLNGEYVPFEEATKKYQDLFFTRWYTAMSQASPDSHAVEVGANVKVGGYPGKVIEKGKGPLPYLVALTRGGSWWCARDQFMILETNASNARDVFLSCQHSALCKEKMDELLGGPATSLKASTPPFNVRDALHAPKFAPEQINYNVSVFGVKMPPLVQSLFEHPEVARMGMDKSIPLPDYAMDTFIQKKMPKALDLVAAAAELGLDSKNMAALAKYRDFCEEFQSLDGGAMSRDAWQHFISKHNPDGWEENLRFDEVLVKNFGFSKEVSDQLRCMTKQVEVRGVMTDVTYEQHSLRWLTKAYKAYGPIGSQTDVINLAFAMMCVEPPKQADEAQVLEVFEKFKRKLFAKDLSDLWIPTHLIHDGEIDDMLTWLLLEYVHSLQGTKLEVCLLNSIEVGDMVEVVMGPCCGRRGRVVQDDGSSFPFYIELEDDPDADIIDDPDADPDADLFIWCARCEVMPC